MEGKRGNDLQALTEIADNDVLIVDTGEGTRKITYGALCAAVKNTLGIREVVESTNITEPGFLMDGKTASEAFAELYSKTSSNIIIRYITSEGEDIEAHSIANYYIATPNIDGYKAILGVYNSNSASSNIIPYKTSGALTSSNNTLSLSVKNIADGVARNVIISAHILYVKI